LSKALPKSCLAAYWLKVAYPTSRHVPAKVNRFIKAEYGTRCSEPGCNKPSLSLGVQIENRKVKYAGETDPCQVWKQQVAGSF